MLFQESTRDARDWRERRETRNRGLCVALVALGLPVARLGAFQHPGATSSRAKAAKTGSNKVPNKGLDPYRGECGGPPLPIWPKLEGA